MIEEIINILSLVYPEKDISINSAVFSHFSLVFGRKEPKNCWTLYVHKKINESFSSLQAMHQYVLINYGVKTKEAGGLTWDQFERMLNPKPTTKGNL